MTKAFLFLGVVVGMSTGFAQGQRFDRDFERKVQLTAIDRDGSRVSGDVFVEARQETDRFGNSISGQFHFLAAGARYPNENVPIVFDAGMLSKYAFAATHENALFICQKLGFKAGRALNVHFRWDLPMSIRGKVLSYNVGTKTLQLVEPSNDQYLVSGACRL